MSTGHCEPSRKPAKPHFTPAFGARLLKKAKEAFFQDRLNNQWAISIQFTVTLNTTMTNHIQPHQFSWTNGNRLTFLRNGDVYYRDVIQAIEQAHYWIAVEMYLVKSGTTTLKVVEALCAASKRGVKVQLLFDALGSGNLQNKDIVHLRAAGCELHFFNPPHAFSIDRLAWFHRDHRKLILIDNLIAFIGGAGIADEFSPKLKDGQHWDDLILMIYGPCVNQWREVFIEAWPGSAPPTDLPAANPANSQRDERGRVCFQLAFAKRRFNIISIHGS